MDQPAPLGALKSFSPFLGRLMLLNPFVYITEGLRYALLGDPQFLPVWQCAPMLAGFTVLFTCGTWHFFKKKIDHI